MVLILSVLVSGCAGAGSTSDSEGGFLSSNGAITVVEPAKRKPAPELSGIDLDGNPVSSLTFKGKVLIVNIWGSWCAPCRAEAPDLIRSSNELKPSGVEFLGIAIRESATSSRAFSDRLKVPYPSISDPSGKLLLGFRRNLPAIAIPTTYVIDREGRVGARILNKVTSKTLASIISEVEGTP
ncbi:TlpA disulfide reductase family protein [soil metagenome]